VRAHEVGGFGSFREYAERLFGCSGRETEERLRLAERLEDLPELRERFARGQITFSAARELSRVTTVETEAVWIAASEGRTAREVEKMVAGRAIGELPDGPSRPEAQMVRLTLRVSAEVFAMFAELREALVKELGHSVSDEEVMAELTRRALLGKPEGGHSGYRVAITRCDRCRHTTQKAGGESVTISEAAFEAAACDAQRVDVSTHAGRATETIPPRIRRAVEARHGGRCAVPGCRSSAFVHIHHIDLRSEGGTHDPERLVPLCGTHHSMTHEGRLVISGAWSSRFTFKHADGTRYGSPQIDGVRAEALAQLFGALCSMGYKERQARPMVDAVAHVGLAMPELLYEALRLAPVPTAATWIREARSEYRPAA
jgi:hypothetical protein